MKFNGFRLLLLASSALALGAGGAYAQQAKAADAPGSGPQSAPAPAPDQAEGKAAVDRIVVVGSQIAGAEITGALPVTVVGVAEIESTAAVSAEDLFRTLPQAGDITFAGTYLGGGNSNAARGDVSTVSLRGLAQGNTLMLINGRRSVLHPTSQTDNQTPVFGYNTNAVPVLGLQRVEVLKDGAAALYGSDAVAGVVNNVLRSDFTGLDISLQYGAAQDTSLSELTGSVLWGTDFAEGRGNISLYFGATDRSALKVSDQAYTSTSDRRSFVANTPWSAATAADARSTSSAWGAFSVPNLATGAALTGTTIYSGGVAVTDAGTAFHIQPSNIVASGAAACRYNYGTVCIGTGGTGATGLARSELLNMRIDTPQSFPDISAEPALKRYNAFSFINYDLSDSVKLYSELGYYKAQTRANIGPGSFLGAAPITIAANAYWNPFGPVGSVNRLPGLTVNGTTTPLAASGLPLTITSYSLVDTGTREVVVDNDQYRALVGLKGDKWGWDWDSAVLYSAAKVHDEADGYSTSLFQAAINRTDASAYNPFSGGNPAAPGIGDSTPNSQATIDSFRIKQVRENKTTLALADFKVSKPDLLTYWAGDIGIAAGVEWRRETYSDNRDARQDTSTPYIDRVRNVLVSTSDLMGHSPSPDVKGARNTTSAYLELAVPLVTPDWNIPLIHKVDLQLAGRYEDFSDVGSVAKPKIAGSWDLWDGFKIRGSWSQGFKAPNLEVVNIPSLERVNSYTDYIQCEADVRAGRRANFSTCGTVYSVSVASLRSGNKNLQPEQSTSYNYGAVFEPKFLPEAFGRVTATIDAWHIEQENVIGLLTDDVALNYDYLLRLGGSSNPLVIRKPPTQAQIDAFRGTGLTAVGDVQNVIASFVNLGPLVVEGVDYGLTWSVPAGPGEFNFNANASQLKKYDQSPTVEGAALVAAKAAGTIPTLVATTGLSYGGSQVEVSGHPKWKYSLNAAYVVENWELGYFMQYTGEVFQAGTTTSTPQGVPWKVQQSWSSNAYVQYKFQTGWLDKGSIRVGVRNLFDQDPPFAFGDTGGWLSSLYQPYPRYWYVNFKKSF